MPPAPTRQPPRPRTRPTDPPRPDSPRFAEPATGRREAIRRSARRYVSFSPRHQPYMTRPSYGRELRASLTFPLAAALAEGAFTGVVAAKYFGAGQLLIAVITAAPMFGNVLAMAWAELARHRPKVPFVNLLQAGCVACVAAVALTRWLPHGPGGGVGGWTFAGLIVLARVLASGIVTLRAAIWRGNYPAAARGQIVSRLTVAQNAALAAMTTAGAAWLNVDPSAYAWLYPLAALLGVVGIWQYAGIRVRGEPAALRRLSVERAGMAPADGFAPPAVRRGPIALGRAGIGRTLGELWRTLRDDPLFLRYQAMQTLMGVSFMMLNPPLIDLVSKHLTDPRRDYLLAVAVLQLIPMLVGLVLSQAWAPLFDRTDILTFRVYHGFPAVAAQGLTFAGAYNGQLWLVALGSVLLGVSLAAGQLAWNLGQNDFAPPERVSTYMGAHVMLTGVRGCFAPFLGVALYSGVTLGGATLVPRLGVGVFAVTTVLCVGSTLGFWYLSRTHRAEIVRRRRENHAA